VFKRKLIKSLKNHLSHKEITLIIGPRQAGKTTLMLLLKDYLEKKGHSTLFLNLDIEADKRFFVSQETLIQKIELELGKKGGFIFQNFVFNILREKLRFSSARVNFWRTTDGAEVDFVLDFARELIPVEVKWTELKKPAITRSLRSFINQYQPSRSYIVNLTLKETLEIEKTEINFIPFSKLIGVKFVA